MSRPRAAFAVAAAAAACALVPVVVASPARAAGPGASASATAASSLELPAAGGLGALSVRVDLAAATLAAGPTTVPIALDRKDVAAAHDVVVEPLAVGDGRTVAHVRIPAADGERAWEAIVSGTGGGVTAPVAWSGVTGFARGEEGERTGQKLQVFARDASTRVVVVGDIREDLHVCGQSATLLSPRALDAKTMQLRGASVQRLPRDQRDAAKKIVAVARAAGGAVEPPLAQLLVAEGASTPPPAKATALVDGDAATSWAEARPGPGAGEFVTLRSPAEVPLARFVVTPAPTAPTAATAAAAAKPNAAGAAPKTFYLVTDARTFEVTMPEDAWSKPGASYDVALPEPVRSSCVTLVLGDAYTRGNARPDVTVAELTAYSELDHPGATLDEVAKLLTGGGPRAQAAAGVLKRVGKGGLAALAAAYDHLDEAGRALAIEAALSRPCEESAPLLVRAMADPDREVARKGREKIESPSCGRNAAPALAAALASGDDATRIFVAPMLAAVAPSQALAPLAAAMGKGSHRVREQVRGAFARAARVADPDKLASITRDAVAAAAHDPVARLDLLRALGPRMADAPVKDTAHATIDALFTGASMPTRWLLVGPVAELARAGDTSAQTRLTALVTKDPDGPVRARAAEAAQGIAAVQGDVVTALSDPEPRVREAAVRTLGGARASAAAVPIEVLLAKDPWTFVRVAAAQALGAMAAAPDIDAALGAAVDDAAPRARVAVLEALGTHRASAFAPELRKILDDDKAPTEVTSAAISALGQMCDAGALEQLTEQAQRANAATGSDADVTVGFAAIDAIGAIHPADVARRLAKLTAPSARPQVRAAALRAIGGKGICR